MTDAFPDDDATTLLTAEAKVRAHARSRTDWLIDNAETYDRVLEALNGARRSIRIAQLAFDYDCLAYGSDASARAPSGDVLLADALLAWELWGETG